MKAGILIVCVLAVGAFFLVKRHEAFDAPAVVTRIQQLHNLVTVRYSIQRVVGLTEEKTPFGSESILLMVQGEAQAGIDLRQIKAQDLQMAYGAVYVTLPKAKLTDVYLDEKQTKIWDRSVTWWTPWVPFNPDLEHKARLQALDEVRASALQMGIIAQAQKNAEVAIKDLLGAMHLDVKYKPGD